MINDITNILILCICDMMILHVDVCCRCPLATPMYTNDVRAEICDANDMKPRDYGPLHSAKARTRLDPCSCSWYVASC